jgi:hypothetical protein
MMATTRRSSRTSRSASRSPKAWQKAPRDLTDIAVAEVEHGWIRPVPRFSASASSS